MRHGEFFEFFIKFVITFLVWDNQVGCDLMVFIFVLVLGLSSLVMNGYDSVHVDGL